MGYMRDSDGVRLDSVPVTDQAAKGATALDLIAGRFPAVQTRKVIGPLLTETCTVALNAAADGTLNRQYVITNNAVPAGWPVEYIGPSYISGNYIYPSALQNGRTIRFMCDAPKVALRLQSGAGPNDGFLLYVDGAPVSLTPYIMTTSGGQFVTFTFPAGPRPRLFELVVTGGLQALYCAQPYRMWKPPTQEGLTGLLVGDSYSAGITFNGADATQSANIYGFAPRMGLQLGVDRWITDGITGSGYTRTGGVGNYNDRRGVHIALNPDIVIVGGGGANDFYNGVSHADVVAAATTYFTQVRAALPNAKLVFMEGFAPPAFRTAVPDIITKYINLRAALQAALADVGVYYIDIATSAQWIDGTGRIGATTGDGNSDVYVGGDNIHLSIGGHLYVEQRVAPPIRKVIVDGGALVNTLI